MRYQDITFTIAPTGGSYTAKLCYTCRTPEELATAKDSIVSCLNNIGRQWDREMEKTESAFNREVPDGT